MQKSTKCAKSPKNIKRAKTDISKGGENVLRSKKVTKLQKSTKNVLNV